MLLEKLAARDRALAGLSNEIVNFQSNNQK